MENEEVLQETENPVEEQPTLEVEEKSEAELKAEEIARNQRIRAEKAEKELKALKAQAPKVEIPKELDISWKEARLLQDVPDDDVEDVIGFAKFKGITIAEAKKSPVVQSLLKTRAEERASAQAANTSSKRGSRKDTSEGLLENFSKNILPQTDEDFRKLAEAQIAARKAKK